jgi:hypothetical protein
MRLLAHPLSKGEVVSSILTGSTICKTSCDPIRGRRLPLSFLTRIVTEGSIRLDPPGITLAMTDIYPP